jgi:hypothetical protein
MMSVSPGMGSVSATANFARGLLPQWNRRGREQPVVRRGSRESATGAQLHFAQSRMWSSDPFASGLPHPLITFRTINGWQHKR